MRNLFFKIFIAAVVLMSASGCMDIPSAYSDVNSVTVTAVYPKGYEDFTRSGVSVSVINSGSRDSYSAVTDQNGRAAFTLPDGLYIISVSDRKGVDIFNGTSDNVNISSDSGVNVSLEHSEGGSLVIKELYVGGCSMAPQEGSYQSDKYAIIHNNLNEVCYLDSLCVGTVSPYNSTASNPWTTKNADGSTVYPAFLPIIQAVWQFGGNGTAFPLQPGEDAVICFNGAIDHTVNVPLSVNLNNAAFFACYNQTFFPNTAYHPAPGDQIKADHILNVVIKTGKANAYTLSVSSPTLILFKAKGMSIQDFVLAPDNIIQVPGSTSDNVVAVPLSWVIDGIEVYDGRSSSNSKRLSPVIDAGYVYQSDTYQGHTLFRKTDEEATKESGYTILQDTNNSTNDLYELQTQSLHK